MTEKRGRGRPRREGADEEILAVAASMLHEKGYRELTVDAVAERAGVAKTTVYRRWPTKGALIAAALARNAPDMPDDVPGIIKQLRELLVLIGDGRSDPDLAHVIAPYRDAIVQLENEFTADLLIAPLLYARELPQAEALIEAIEKGVRMRSSRRSP
jgi:AcrR family transcriptional regulator